MSNPPMIRAAGGRSDLRDAWQLHYQRDRARQIHPDENLVRLLSQAPRGAALDLGCGSGRHLRLLADLQYSPLYGADLSAEALVLSAEQAPTAQFFNLTDDLRFALPLADGELQLVVAWGVLHYNDAAVQERMLSEVRRVLHEEGHFLGTLRADDDTHFRENRDLAGAGLQLFTAEQALALLRPWFESVELGHVSRTPIGELDRRIAHWIFRAKP